MGWPEIRYPDGTEIAPQLDLRVELELYAGVRPARAIPGIPLPLADPRAANIDLVIVRESTEGLFASRGKGVVDDDREARDTMVITRARLRARARLRVPPRAAAQGARAPGRVTCVDKANVFRSMAFFRKIFDERARAFPDIEARHHYVDATALDLVRQPWDFDVLVTENMFGDILSDLTAGARRRHGHGAVRPTSATSTGCSSRATAPRRTSPGQGKANPTAMILSAAMMLDWLAERGTTATRSPQAAQRLERAVDAVFASGQRACRSSSAAGRHRARSPMRRAPGRRRPLGTER